MPEATRRPGEGCDLPLPALPIGRRRFLQGVLAAAGGLAVTGMGGHPTTAHKIPAHAKHHKHHTQPAVTNTVLDSGVVVPTARWLVEENAKPGTNNWVVTGIQT